MAVVGINSNDAEIQPEDSPEKMAEEAKRRGYSFPYLYDQTQETAKAYHAACTPDFYVFDKQRRLVYRGQIDASRPGSDIPVTGDNLRAALDAVLAGRAVPKKQRASAAAASSGGPATSRITARSDRASRDCPRGRRGDSPLCVVRRCTCLAACSACAAVRGSCGRRARRSGTARRAAAMAGFSCDLRTV